MKLRVRIRITSLGCKVIKKTESVLHYIQKERHISSGSACTL